MSKAAAETLKMYCKSYVSRLSPGENPPCPETVGFDILSEMVELGTPRPVFTPMCV